MSITSQHFLCIRLTRLNKVTTNNVEVNKNILQKKKKIVLNF